MLPSSIKIRICSGGCRQEEIYCMYINRAGAIRRTSKIRLASYVPRWMHKLRIEGKRLCSRRDAQINLGEVDYAAGMAEIDYAAEKDALVKLRKEERAAGTEAEEIRNYIYAVQPNSARRTMLQAWRGKLTQKRKM